MAMAWGSRNNPQLEKTIGLFLDTAKLKHSIKDKTTELSRKQTKTNNNSCFAHTLKSSGHCIVLHSKYFITRLYILAL